MIWRTTLVLLIVGLLFLPTMRIASAKRMFAVLPDQSARDESSSQLVLAQPTKSLFASKSGRLFAHTTVDLVESDDKGATWNSIPLPISADPQAAVIAIAPQNGDAIYSTGAEFVYKSTDSGVSWIPVLARSIFPTERASQSASPTVWVLALSVSPADQDILYGVIAGTPPPGTRDIGNSSYAFVRSLDGGGSWSILKDLPYGNNECRWAVELLLAHPTSPNRLFYAPACRHGIVADTSLDESVDQGGTFN